MYKLISNRSYVANPVIIAGQWNQQSVDYYIPESLIGESLATKNIGIHIHYHGGSWWGGDKTNIQEITNAKHAAYKIANQSIDNTIIVSVNYRLTRYWHGDDDLRLLPESLGADYPNEISLEDIYDDSLAAFNYVINDLGTNWTGLDLDTAKITLSGYSAGSHIISTLLLRTESYSNANNYLDKVQDVILYASPANLSHYIEGPSLDGHPENPDADDIGREHPDGTTYQWLDIDNAAELNFLQRVSDEILLYIAGQPPISQTLFNFLNEDIFIEGQSYTRADLNLSGYGGLQPADNTPLLEFMDFSKYDQHIADHILTAAINDPVIKANYGLPQSHVNNNWLYESYTTRDYVNGTQTTVQNPLNNYWATVHGRSVGGTSGVPDVNDLKIWLPYFKYNSLAYWFASWISTLPSPYSLSDYNPTDLLANNQASLPLNYNIHMFHGEGDTLTDYGVAQTFANNYNAAVTSTGSTGVAQMTTIVDDPSTPHTPLVSPETSGPLDTRYEWNESDHNLLGLYLDPNQGFDNANNLWGAEWNPFPNFQVTSTATTTSISQTEYDSILDSFLVTGALTGITLSNTNVLENSTVGTIVGDLLSVFEGSDTLTASEYATLSAQHTFAVANTDSNYAFFDAFEVNTNKQLVIKNNILNYEAASTVQVNIRVTDQDGLTFEKAFSIGVLDVNEAPNFVVTTLTTPEHVSGGSVPAGGTHVSHIQGVDPDNDTITYSIVGGADAALFEIASSGDMLHLVAGVSLDYETQNQLIVTIRATDPGGLTFDKTVTISVTDVYEGPTDITLSGTSVQEHSAVGTVVGDLTAIDDEITDTHSFSLVGGTGSNLFEINTNNQLVVKSSTGLDYETLSQSTVIIRVTDQNSLTFDKTFTIYVTNINEGPTDITLSSNTVIENSAVGTVVGDLTATDVDINDIHSFSVVGVTAYTLFEINTNNQLVVKSSTIPLAVGQSTVTIRVTDQSGLTFDKTFTISVTGINYAPTDITLSSNTVIENSAVGTVVGDLTAADVNINDIHGFSVVGGTGSNLFVINTNNQLVVKSSTGLDYETQNQLTVTIRVTDQSGLTFDKTFTISVTNINESPTDITLSGTSVQEHSAVGTVVGDLTATDPETTNTHSFSLVGGTGSNLFEINTNNQLVVKSLLDANILSSPTVIIRATDQSGLTFDKTFTIYVTLYTDLRDLREAVQPYRGLGATSRLVKTTSVSEIIPDHLSLNNDYISFLDGYISFLEQHKHLVEYLSIIDNKDIDFRKELNSHLKVIFGTGIPDNYKGNISLLYKDLMDLYRTSGTVESIQLFFKIFYESPAVKVTYPKHNLLTPSPNVSANGMLSNTNIKVQDSLFYQLYSYFISNVNVTKSQWGVKFLKGQHPAGYKMFSELVYELTATTKIFRQLNHPNTCIEPNGSYICSMYILDLISRPSTADAFIIHAVDNLIEKILLLYSIDRPFGMNAWFDDVKFKLTSNTSSWDKYTINSTIQYKVPGNIEATCLDEASDNIIINLDTI